MNMTNAPSSSNQNSPRGSHDISHSLSERSIPFESRDVRIGGRGVNLVNILFHCDFSIGNQILKYLPLRDVRALREVCTEMSSMLFEKEFFSLRITPDKLPTMRLQDYPRVYPRVKGLNEGNIFMPLPIEAVVENAADLQTILKDKRFIVKSIVVKGTLEDLRRVRTALPSSMTAIEIKQEPLLSQSAHEATNVNFLTSDNEVFNEAIEAVNDLAKQESVLSKLSDVNVKDKKGFTVLQHACMAGDKGLVKLLIENFKARIDEGNVDNQTALHLTIINGHNEIANYLIVEGENSSREESIKKLFLHLNDQRKINLLEIRDNNGYTALHYAAVKKENIKVLKTLIKGGADIDVVNNDGDTPLMVAIKNNNIGAMSYLSKAEMNKYCSSANEKMLEYLERGNIALFYNDFGGSLDKYAKGLEDAQHYKNNVVLCFILIKLGDACLNIRDNIKPEYYDRAAKFYSSAFALTVQDSKVAEIFNLQYFIDKQYSVETKFIREQCKNKEAIPVPSFIYYRTMLKVARENAASLLKREKGHIKNILIGLTRDLKKIVSHLFTESMTIMGKAPCEYALLGLGSMSRNEMAPFSDVEIALVVSDSTQEIKTYFNNVLRLLQLKMISLGETEFKILDRGTTSIMPSGFSLDSGGNTPLGKEELIGTPEELARFQSMDKFGEDIILSNVLKTVSLIQGNEKLLLTYENKIRKVLSNRANAEKTNFLSKSLSGYQAQALELIKGDTKEFSPDLGTHREQCFNVKKELYRLPNNFISYMALYYQLTEKNSWDRLNKLLELKIISKEGCINLQKIIEFSTSLRLKTHLYYGQEMEYIFHKRIAQEQYIVNSKNEKIYEINENELKHLVESYRILISLHSAIMNFLKDRDKEKLGKAVFYTENSLYVDGLLCERRGDYKAAIDSYQKALQLQPEDLAILFNFIQLKIYRNDFKGCNELAFKALKIALHVHGKNHWEYVQAMYNVANTYDAESQYDKAIEFYSKIIELKDDHKNCEELIARSFRCLGIIYIKNKQYEKSIESLHQELKFRRDKIIIKDFGIAETLNHLAQAYMLQENYDAAEKYAREALKIYKNSKEYGLEVIRTLDHLGDIYFASGETTKAEECYNEALIIRKRFYGEGHPEMIKSYDNFSNICYSYGQYNKAIQYCSKALAVRIKIYKGEQFTEVAENYSKLSDFYFSDGKFEEAIECGEKALDINSKIYLNNIQNPKIIECYQNLGDIYYADGKIEIAKEHYSKVITTLQEISDGIIIRSLKSNYRRYNKLKRFVTEEECTLINSYINLAIVKPSGFKESKEEKRKIIMQSAKEGNTYRDERLANYELIYEMDKSISLTKLFDSSDVGKDAKKLIIYGSAGIGKSTMCQYVVAKWQHGSLWQNKFEAIFWLPLRKLINYPVEDFPSLSKVIIDTCIEKGHIAEQDIEAFIEQHSSKILFILDGYDEIAQVVSKNVGLEKLLLEVLSNQNWHVLLTSRPMSLTSIGTTPIKFDNQLENIGFTNENIKKYAKKFFPSDSKKLLQFLHTDSSIWGIAHVPINLELICSVWSPFMEISTLTDLYEQIVVKLMERYLEKYHKIHSNSLPLEDLTLKTSFVSRALEDLAITGIINNQIIIPASVVDEVVALQKEGGILFEELLQSGVIRTVDNGAEKKDIYFLHLTFQEYYAASWIVRALSGKEGKDYEQALELIAKYKYTSYYEMVWWFTAGLIYNQSDAKKDYTTLEKFWSLLNDHPRDLLGSKHMHLIIKCLDESKADEKIPMLKQQLQITQSWLERYLYEEFEDDYLYFHGISTWKKRLEMCSYVLKSHEVLEVLIKGLFKRNDSINKNSTKIIEGRGSNIINERSVEMLAKAQTTNSQAIATLLKLVKDDKLFSLEKEKLLVALGKIGNRLIKDITLTLIVFIELNEKKEKNRDLLINLIENKCKELEEIVKSLLEFVTSALPKPVSIVRDKDASPSKALAKLLKNGFKFKWSIEIMQSTLENMIRVIFYTNEMAEVEKFFASCSASGVIDVLGYMGGDYLFQNKIIPLLIKELIYGNKNYDYDIIGPNIAKALGRIAKQLKQNIEDRYGFSLDVVQYEWLEKIVASLTRVLNERKGEICLIAAQELIELGKLIPEIRIAMSKMVSMSPNFFGNKRDIFDKTRAVEIFLKFKPDSKEIEPLLLSIVQSLNKDNILYFPSLLEALGKELEKASPEIVAIFLHIFLKFDNLYFFNAENSFTKFILPILEQISPMLIQALRNTNAWLIKHPVKQLKMPVSNETLISLLIKVLKLDEGTYAQGFAATVLGKLSYSQEIADILIKDLKSKDGLIRKYAISILSNIEINSPELISVLIEMLKDHNTDVLVREYAISTLSHLAINSPQLIPVLVEIFEKGSTEMKALGVKALIPNIIDIKEDKEELLAALVKTLQSDERLIKDAAVKGLLALRQIPEMLSFIAETLYDINNQLIKQLGEKLPVEVLINCFAKSNNSRWLEPLFDPKKQHCLTLDQTTITLHSNQKMERFELTLNQINSLLSALKQIANQNQKLSLNEAYNYYLEKTNLNQK